MLDTATFRKDKIELSEYDYLKDIQNRLLMADFSLKDLEVLEEILYSSLRIPFSILKQNLSLSSDELLPILEKLAQTKLFSIASDHVLVDKEMRKYYEFQILKFEEDFKPGMEYLQGLLRKVPIHILPTWYSISRTSNNIFESIVEKYLFTPQIFQRYLLELNLTNPVQKGIMTTVYQSPNFEVDAADMLEKFNLTPEQFEEHMILLEFRLVCCVKYRREGDGFKEVVSPFREWQEYLCHVQDSEPLTIIDEEKIKREKSSDFAFVEEMSAILNVGQNDSVAIEKIKKTCPEFREENHEYMVEKLISLNLVERSGKKLIPTSDGAIWIKMQPLEQALYVYRHPLQALSKNDIPEELCQEKIVREAEKCISSVVNRGWVYLEDFLKGIFIPLSDSQVITLKRIGRAWGYQLPTYTESELDFFRALIKHWFYEVGITRLGKKDNRLCFYVSSLGTDFFGNE